MIGQTLVTCAALELEAEPTRLNPCTQEKGQRRPTTLTLTSLYEAARNVAVDSGRHFPHSVALRFNCSEAPPGCSPPCSLSSPPAPHQTRWKPRSPGLRCPARDEGSPPHPPPSSSRRGGPTARGEGRPAAPTLVSCHCPSHQDATCLAPFHTPLFLPAPVKEASGL